MNTKRFCRALPRLAALLLAAAALLLPSACSLINEEEGDCTPMWRVRFVYERNLKFVDAFASEVKAVQLYVVDTLTNQIVYQTYEEGDKLAQEGYYIDVPVKQGGAYRVVAWCTNNANQWFRINTSNSKSADWLSCSILDREVRSKLRELADASKSLDDIPFETDSAYVDDKLDDLYHGCADAVEVTEGPSQQTTTIELTKNTNTINVMLQHLSGQPLDMNEFNFVITADNGKMRWDNSIVAGHPVTYTAHHLAGGSTDVESGAGNLLSLVVAEFTTGRLVTTDSPRLTITRKADNSTVLSVPVTDYVLLMKGFDRADMDDQEYLDRQDGYNFTFFLDERDQWISTFLYINSWKLVLINKDL